jgi:hypothetical protein
MKSKKLNDTNGFAGVNAIKNQNDSLAAKNVQIDNIINDVVEMNNEFNSERDRLGQRIDDLIPSRRTALIIESDFYGITSPFTQGLTGAAVSSGTLVAVTGTANHPGIVALRDSTTANGGYRIFTDVAALLLAGGEKSVVTFQIRSVRAGVKSFIGFLDNATIADPTDCACLIITANGTVASIIARTRANNTATDSAIPFVPEINTWYTSVITVADGGGSALFQIFNDSGTMLWSDTLSNIPTATGRETGFSVAAYESSVDAAADIIHLDYMRLEINRRLTR